MNPTASNLQPQAGSTSGASSPLGITGDALQPQASALQRTSPDTNESNSTVTLLERSKTTGLRVENSGQRAAQAQPSTVPLQTTPATSWGMYGVIGLLAVVFMAVLAYSLFHEKNS